MLHRKKVKTKHMYRVVRLGQGGGRAEKECGTDAGVGGLDKIEQHKKIILEVKVR